ncbi:kinesin-like protein [Achlya hypogyna]|uniref:Kinesin-like protein n=1 Tax=Achlya hypogyna TaxID=1202772 RepID=A0A1V9ZTK6_ACHHY|nr:kinesin-like protein [Achlya hypogyna]
MTQRTPRAVAGAWGETSSPALHRSHSMSPLHMAPHLAFRQASMSSPRGSLTSRRDSDQRRAQQAGLSLLGLAFDGIDAASPRASYYAPQYSPSSPPYSPSSQPYSTSSQPYSPSSAPFSPTSSSASHDYDAVEGVDPHLFLEGVKEHARYLGIDPEADAEYLWIAKESLVAPMPAGWHQVMTSEGAPYYYNDDSGESRWEHPSDRDYMELFQEIRRRTQCGEPVDLVALKHQLLATNDAWRYESQSSWGYDAASPTSSHAVPAEYVESDAEDDPAPLRRKKSAASFPSADDHRELLEKLHGEIHTHKETIAGLHSELAEARAEASAAKDSARAVADDELTAKVAELEAVVAAGETAQTDLHEALRVARQQVVEATGELEVSKSKVAQENLELRATVATLTADELRRWQKKCAAIEAARDAAQSDLAAMATEIQALKEAQSVGNDAVAAASAQHEAALERVAADHTAVRLWRKSGRNTVAKALTAATTDAAKSKATVEQLVAAIEAQKAEFGAKSVGRLLAAETKVAETTKELQLLQTTNAKYKAKCKKLEAAVATAEAAAATASAALAAADADLQNKLAQSKQAGAEDAARQAAAQVAAAEAEKEQLAALYAQEMKIRRQLHNKMMELGGNIRVFCRVRPIQPVELQSGAAAEAVAFRSNDSQALELVVAEGQKHTFEFDHVFQPSSSQTQVFEQTKALVVSAMDGFKYVGCGNRGQRARSVCIFAYGQTGSGKTHTMEGPAGDRGVNFRAMEELFRVRDERLLSGHIECDMKLSILEVYNETIVDLLDDTQTAEERRVLEVRMGKHGAFVENLMEVEVASTTDVEDLMRLGHSHRSVGGHDFNEHSSRSHLVLSITITSVQKMDGKRATSKLHLIDLAGSERISKTAASGQRLKEAQHINRSLSALGDVIAALGTHSKHVPYRNSKLTFLLQESLSGNSKVLMFVNVSPVAWNAWESLCSLNFAQRCRSVALKTTTSPLKAKPEKARAKELT